MVNVTPHLQFSPRNPIDLLIKLNIEREDLKRSRFQGKQNNKKGAILK